MTFTIPIRTRSLNHGGGREHWAARAKRVKAERDATCCSAQTTAQARFALAGFHMLAEEGKPLTVSLTRVSPGTLDGDNLQGALKHVRDQIAEMLGVDDRDPVVTWRYEQRKGKRGEYAVEVRIEAGE